MITLFVFGTLKKGFPLHQLALGDVPCRGTHRTVTRYPMLIAGPWFAPMMLPEPGSGHRVVGELYEIEAARLARIDAIESVGIPGNLRLAIEVEALDGSARRHAFAYLKDRALAVPAHSALLADYQDRRFIPPWRRQAQSKKTAGTRPAAQAEDISLSATKWKPRDARRPNAAAPVGFHRGARNDSAFPAVPERGKREEGAMNVGNELSRSLWMDVKVAPRTAALKRDLKADTVVIGSGIAGLSTAYELSGQGQKVIVLDRGKIGSGMTARTTAHLSANNDDGFKAMIEKRGEKLARDYYVSQQAAIDRIDTIQRAESIDCDFRRLDGVLFPGPQTSAEELEEERKASERAGMPVESSRGLPLDGHESTPCLRYPNQAAFHPTKYLAGLARCIQARGGKLFADTAVVGVEEDDDGVVVTTEGGHKVRARAAVVATNSPINDRVALHSKQAPYRTYAMALALPRGALPDALYWDTLDPYHYVRLQPGDGHDFLIVGGADHKSGEADDAQARYEALEAWIRNLVPQLGDVTHRWSGQVLDTIDYSGFSGRNPGNQNVYVHTGDSGQGLTHGVVGSLIIARAIMQGEPLWQALYRPDRKTASALSTFIGENLTAVKNLAEYIAPGELGSYAEIAPGQGAIVRDGMSKVAAYRGDDGVLHARSAVCTHLGCHLHFNSFERCWDCPCHGSQFGIDGEVLNGPAIYPLEEVAVQEHPAHVKRAS